MKTIQYDPHNYEVIDTIQFGKDEFQKVKFPSGHYGIIYVVTDKNKKYYDVILIGTDKEDIYTNLFLELARNQTETLNNIHEKVDTVHLIVQLDKKHSEIFEEVVSKDTADDLIERLRISNEIHDLQAENKVDGKFILFTVILFILFNIACIILKYGG